MQSQADWILEDAQEAQRGDAHSIVKSTLKDNGWEAWRQVHENFDAGDVNIHMVYPNIPIVYVLVSRLKGPSGTLMTLRVILPCSK